MLTHDSTEALQLLKHELNGLGYVGGLIQEDYNFADVLLEDVKLTQIPLAAFAQDPPSYRNAAIGVAVANGSSGVELVQMHRALGAPQIFEIRDNRVLRWKVTSEGSPSLLDEVTIEELPRVFAQHKSLWTPQHILRAKSDSSVAIQLDFVDLGLMPRLEHEARTKLDRNLRGAVSLAIDTFQHRDEIYRRPVSTTFSSDF